MAAKKAAAKKAPAKKKAAAKKKATTKKAPAKKKVAAKKVTTTAYTAEQLYSMTQQAAYFAASNDGFAKDPSEYWAQAEKEITNRVK